MGHYDGLPQSSWLTLNMFRLRGPQTCGLLGCSLLKYLLTMCHSVTFQMKRIYPLSSAMDNYPLVQKTTLPRED